MCESYEGADSEEDKMVREFDKDLIKKWRGIVEEGKKRKGRKLSYSARAGGVGADLSSAAGIMASDRVNSHCQSSVPSSAYALIQWVPDPERQEHWASLTKVCL